MSRPSTAQVVIFSPFILLGAAWELVVRWFNVGRAFAKDFL